MPDALPRDFSSESEMQFRARFRDMESAAWAMWQAAQAAERRAARLEAALRLHAKMLPERHRAALLSVLGDA